MNGSVGKAYRQPLNIILFHQSATLLICCPSTTIAVSCRQISPIVLVLCFGMQENPLQHFKYIFPQNELAAVRPTIVHAMSVRSFAFLAMRLLCATRSAWHIDLFKCCFSPLSSLCAEECVCDIEEWQVGSFILKFSLFEKFLTCHTYSNIQRSTYKHTPLIMAAAQRQKFPHGSMLYTQIYISIHMYMLHRKAKNSLV